MATTPEAELLMAMYREEWEGFKLYHNTGNALAALDLWDLVLDLSGSKHTIRHRRMLRT